ncbi:MAG: hypothetical protein AAF389_00190 [Gemmatimonadota bacterium]
MSRWLERTGHEAGVTISFDQMWALVQPWYAGRLDREWRGRTAQDAQDILDSVGLTGDFWRLTG